MTAYRAGQRVRIELEGTVDEVHLGGKVLTVAVPAHGAVEIAPDCATVTVLSEPRPDEPTGLGAVVEADCVSVLSSEPVHRLWVRSASAWSSDGFLWHAGGMDPRKWSDLIDPVVLHEGWTP